MTVKTKWEKKLIVDARDFEPGKRVRILTSAGLTYNGVLIANESRHFLLLDQSGEEGFAEAKASEAVRSKVRIAAAHVVSIRRLAECEPVPEKAARKEAVAKSVGFDENVKGGIAANIVHEFSALMLWEVRIHRIEMEVRGYPTFEIKEREPGIMLWSALEYICGLPERQIERVRIHYFEDCYEDK